MTINPHSWRVATWMNRPEMKILRGDPRFQAIRQRLGLPDRTRSLPVEPETHTRDARRDDDERLQEGRGLPTQVLLRVRVEGVEDVDEAR